MPKNRRVVYEGVEGEGEDAEVVVPGLPVFHRGVPQLLPEPTAKELVESSGSRFHYAKKAKPKKVAKEE